MHRHKLFLRTRVLRQKGELEMRCFESMNNNLTENLTSFLQNIGTHVLSSFLSHLQYTNYLTDYHGIIVAIIVRIFLSNSSK